MAARIRIAIDCMSGDFGLRSTLPATSAALSSLPDIELVLVGNQQQISSQLGSELLRCSRLSVVHADDVVLMSDKPSTALRKKTHSSMRIAIDLLAQQAVDAVVSAGNTGALMAMGCYVLKTLPGIDRPAICSSLPGAGGHGYLLDSGANVDSCAGHLHQFAIMGAALSFAIDAKARPRIAVLNIGQEESKGNERVRHAARLIEADEQLNFIGSIEGDQLFTGKADIIVCDGFVGNVALKACEGTAAYIAGLLQQQFRKNVRSRMARWMIAPVLNRLARQLDPQYYSGASFLGLQGIIVKSHGNSSAQSFTAAILQAKKAVEAGMLRAIEHRLLTLTAS